MRLKLFIISTLVICSGLFIAAPRARAITVTCNTDPNNTLSCACSQPEAQKSPACKGIYNPADPVAGSQGVIAKAISLVLFITGIASVIVIMLGGIQYMLSSGESAKVNKAKDTILYAVIGLIISVFASVIVKFVVNKF